MKTHWAKFETVTMYTKILKTKVEFYDNLKRKCRHLFPTYFTNKLHRLHICYNACSRQQLLSPFSIDLVYLVNVGKANFILAQKFVSLILIQWTTRLISRLIKNNFNQIIIETHLWVACIVCSCRNKGYFEICNKKAAWYAMFPVTDRGKLQYIACRCHHHLA